MRLPVLAPSLSRSCALLVPPSDKIRKRHPVVGCRSSQRCPPRPLSASRYHFPAATKRLAIHPLLLWMATSNSLRICQGAATTCAGYRSSQSCTYIPFRWAHGSFSVWSLAPRRHLQQSLRCPRTALVLEAISPGSSSAIPEKGGGSE